MSEILVAPRRPGGHGSDRGRPRDLTMDESILVATIQLLSEVGYPRLTVAEVARRAGVSKPAIYRRWAQKSQLVVEAMVTQMPRRLPPDTGSTAGDLLALTEQLMTTLTKTPLACSLRARTGRTFSMTPVPGSRNKFSFTGRSTG